MIDERKLIEVCRRNSIPDGNIFIEDLEDWIGELPKAGEWISCSERLPDRNGNYLITVSSFDETASIEYEAIDHYNAGRSPGWQSYSEPSKRCRRGSRVVAWMPLPEAWKGGSDGR